MCVCEELDNAMYTYISIYICIYIYIYTYIYIYIYACICVNLLRAYHALLQFTAFLFIYVFIGLSEFLC